MVLTPLDVNDPQPRRDDPRFDSDYKAFRKADKAWNERERSRRAKKAKLEASAPGAEQAALALTERAEHAEQAALARIPAASAAALARIPAASAAFPKPRGRAPRVGGVECTWEARKGCWLDAAGYEPDLVALRAAATSACAQKRIQAARQRRREAAAQLDDALACAMNSNEEAALHACIAPYAAWLQKQVLCSAEDEVLATGSSTIDHGTLAKVRRVPGHESFLAQLRELGGEIDHVITQRATRLQPARAAYCLRVRRGEAYWTAAGIMIGTQEKPGPFFKDLGLGAISACSAGEFRHHLQRHLRSRVDQLWEQRWSECLTFWKAQRVLKEEAERRQKESKAYKQRIAAELDQWLKRHYAVS